MCRYESSTIGLHFCSSSIEQGDEHYWERQCATSSFHICHSHGGTGPETRHQCMGKACPVFYFANIFIAYTPPSTNISQGVFSLCSDDKHLSKSLNSSLAFATGHILSPLSASGRLKCVRCKRERIIYLARQSWMWRVFWLTVQC